MYIISACATSLDLRYPNHCHVISYELNARYQDLFSRRMPREREKVPTSLTPSPNVGFNFDVESMCCPAGTSLHSS